MSTWTIKGYDEWKTTPPETGLYTCPHCNDGMLEWELDEYGMCEYCYNEHYGESEDNES